MKNYIYVLALAILPLSVLAQTNKGGLKVFIENAEKDNIMGAAVQLIDKDGGQLRAGATDFTGYLYLPNIEAGSYKVMITHRGWENKVLWVGISSNSIFPLRLQMDPSPLELTVLVENAQRLRLRNVELQVSGTDSTSNIGYCAKNGIGWLQVTAKEPQTLQLSHPLCKNREVASAYTLHETVSLELNILGKILKVFRRKK